MFFNYWRNLAKVQFLTASPTGPKKTKMGSPTTAHAHGRVHNQKKKKTDKNTEEEKTNMNTNPKQAQKKKKKLSSLY